MGSSDGISGENVKFIIFESEKKSKDKTKHNKQQKTNPKKTQYTQEYTRDLQFLIHTHKTGSNNPAFIFRILNPKDIQQNTQHFSSFPGKKTKGKKSFTERKNRFH